ncbi:putative FMN-dependent luciferase-like monooxygenase [Formicincola oecophyllae]|uniref:Putative FMN-dependent luciferase-like monooxygenase n=1 Tax=Formicincola oecophyllae TaxID=2558361 RepID=A0A4Y6UCH3_9PROT|nr:putative FMN-dependent luciferase-like monooxygenase [Formicincola oecophyllae]QDH14091.1 putative FMN-dependent luciferase-like monooxygenase [Formicincola oecophyllae]
MHSKSIGFFTRLLDEGPAAKRYQLAGEQIQAAEKLGFNTAWVAQHHFHPAEGGLPSPLPFLAHVAAKTSAIHLGTGVITLPMEDAIRVAEDAAVVDILSQGRLEVGFGSGGTPSSYAAFGHDFAQRHALMNANLATIKQSWAGQALPGGNVVWPQASGLGQRCWQATFSAFGARMAGSAGDGLMLSRTQPRPQGWEGAPLHALQQPLVEAYLESLPQGVPARIMASRTVVVADSRQQALDWAQAGLFRQVPLFRQAGFTLDDSSLENLIQSFDVILGTPEEVARQLAEDRALDKATEVAIQVHSVDPPPEATLRSLALFSTQVAPALGWR